MKPTTEILKDLLANEALFTDPFFKRFTLRHAPQPLALTEDITKNYRFPTFYGDVTCAIAIFGLTLWTLFELGPDRDRLRPTITATPRQRRGALGVAWGLTGLIYLQTLLGALVAGLKAGRTYNTWPLMDGALIPAGLGHMTPAWHNFFENPALVQLNHRLLAYILVALSAGHAIFLWRSLSDGRARRAAGLLAALMLAQAALGVWTLLAWVPVNLGVAHQAGALVTFATALWHLFAIRQAHAA